MEFEADSALLVIDMLNDFIEEGGALLVPGARRIVPRIAEIIAEAADPDANIIFGAVIDEKARDEVRITVIATGFEAARRDEAVPAPAQERAREPVKLIDDLDIPAFLRRR